MAQPRLPRNYQWWKGSIRVRVWVPEECRAKLGKSELVKALDTKSVNTATDRGAAFIAGFKQMVREARPKPLPEWQAFRPDWQFALRQIESTNESPKLIDVTPAKPDAFSFAAMIEDCAADMLWPADRIKVIKSTFSKLAQHCGHDNAKDVTLPELSGFKTKMLKDYEARGGTRNTVKQLLSPVKVAFKWAAANGRLDSNPAATLTVDKVKVGTRPDFSAAETVLILTAAREIKAEQRWFIWLMASTGASNREIYSCERDDFRLEGETIVWDLRGTKAEARERAIPLPSYLASEGFWQFVQSRPGKLFLTKRVDEKCNDWIKTLTLADGEPISKTVYSFRHRLATQLRNPNLNIGDDLQRYYLGHSGGDVHSTYGETLVDYLVEIIERVPAPV
jgi:integrase